MKFAGQNKTNESNYYSQEARSHTPANLSSFIHRHFCSALMCCKVKKTCCRSLIIIYTKLYYHHEQIFITVQ